MVFSVDYKPMSMFCGCYKPDVMFVVDDKSSAMFYGDYKLDAMFLWDNKTYEYYFSRICKVPSIIVVYS